jgi:hypothetical protein
MHATLSLFPDYLPLQKQAKPQKSPFIISEVLDTYLRELYSYRFLKAEQLTRLLHSMGSLTKVQARLKQLTDHRYLHAFMLPTVKSKSPYIYVVAAKGIRYLKDQGVEATAYYRPSEITELSHSFLWHVLELNEFLIAGRRVTKAHPAFSLVSWQHDLDMKGHPMKVSLVKAGPGQKDSIKVIWPDGWMVFGQKREGRKDAQIAFWVELDRGTESVKPFKEKIVKILSAIKSGECQKYFAIEHIDNIVFATTAGENRVEQMRKWTMEQLAALHVKPETRDMFVFSSYRPGADPQEVFFEPRWQLPLKEAAKIALLGRA